MPNVLGLHVSASEQYVEWILKETAFMVQTLLNLLQEKLHFYLEKSLLVSCLLSNTLLLSKYVCA